MKQYKSLLPAVLAATAMGILILDTKTALVGAAAGVKLCLEVLIPSLFPFFVVSILLSSSLMGVNFRWLQPLCRPLKVPSGGEYLVLLGILGGYPTGAQSIAQAQRAGQLSQSDARRMMAFCCNAGPSFLFGIGARLFTRGWICWALWGIHLLSAFLVGLMTPGNGTKGMVGKPISVSLPAALKSAVEVMGLVCGWVVLFKVLLTFAQRWFLWLLPLPGQVIFSGLLELSNGCCSMLELENTGLKMLLCSGFLSFGGLCVALQTRSVTVGVDTSLYLPGKAAQAALSMLLCLPMQLLLPRSERLGLPLWAAGLCACVCIFYGLAQRKRQNNSRFYTAAGV